MRNPFRRRPFQWSTKPHVVTEYEQCWADSDHVGQHAERACNMLNENSRSGLCERHQKEIVG